MDNKTRQLAVGWANDLANISIAGLVLEASFQGMVNSHEPKSTENDTGLLSAQRDSTFLDGVHINIQAEVPQDQACQEAQTDVLLSSQACNDESSLGLAGIKWSDSLGPFDLGVPASRKLINGGEHKWIC
ncbi:hypothetical protein PanWU01x14_242060 [Parasponia andersonii]|uniref:Uncharacterized protein n=1 Tax=Parasponia andersonii TaxID=3476 RepID=A0A2P5BGA4_PARAD|nr:hypothetical protein PanWU01x14_242060 [Parasponia andersonii]